MENEWTYSNIDWLSSQFEMLVDMAKRGQAEFPREGLFKIKRFKEVVPARIYRPIPFDPESAEVLDRWPMLEGEIDGKEADFREVWVYGRAVEKGEYECLRAMRAIRNS